jgi:NCS2 family nucleobase:cation symporter-2
LATQIHPVDELLPPPRLLALGLQHVLVMYAGAVAVPLIVGRALGLAPEQVAILISADLFACGIATLIQSIGFPGVGIRLPVMMGVTFASVSPMLAMAANADVGLLGIYGAVIAAGVFGVAVAPFMSRMLALFPPVVTGTIIIVIGVSLMRVGINWAGGGIPMLTKTIEGTGVVLVANPAYGALDGIAIAAFVLVVVLLLTRYGKGFVANVAVLLGIVAGAILAALMGKMHFDKVGQADWFGLILPLQFGMPTFDVVAVLTMCLVMIVVMVESTGMFLALGDITGKPVDEAALTRGLRADGVGTIIGGIFNTFPYTSFSQNVGLVGVTGVRSRWVTVTGGAIMLMLGLMPKTSSLVEAVPVVVLGGAGIVMFGMVAATGARILQAVDFRTNRFNLLIVAVAIGFGMIPLVAPGFFKQLPHGLQPLLDSGILLAAIAAVALNVFFNGTGGAATRESVIQAAQAAEAH